MSCEHFQEIRPFDDEVSTAQSRLIAINEGERSLTAADVSAVYQINGDETKHSARNRMLANSHAGGDAPAFHLEVSQTTQRASRKLARLVTGSRLLSSD